MHKLQVQGVHHITLTGADRQTSIDFWEGVLGMPFIFDQPNLDDPDEGHLYFDPGDGRLITIFTNESRKPVHNRTPTDPGCVHHLAFNVSHATFSQVADRLDARGIPHSGPKDRGFMDSIYFKDPLGFLIELALVPRQSPARRQIGVESRVGGTIKDRRVVCAAIGTGCDQENGAERGRGQSFHVECPFASKVMGADISTRANFGDDLRYQSIDTSTQSGCPGQVTVSRKAVGLWPVQRRNARTKDDASEKPRR